MIKNDRFEMEMAVIGHFAGSHTVIEDSEKRGQARMVNSDTLPTDGTSDPEEVDQWRKIGVKLGDLVNNDPLFRFVELPEGWKKVPTDHSMYSNLIDEKGRKRATIFYKAAPYDRSANIYLVRRFSVDDVDENGDCPKFDAEVVFGRVKEGDKEIYRTRAITKEDCISPVSEWDNRTERVYDAARRIAYEWLNENFPDHNDVLAYWD